MKCFGNNKPKTSSSDKIRDLKARTIYKSTVADYQQRLWRGAQTSRSRGSFAPEQCSTYNGRTGFYRNGLLRNTRSFNNKNLLQRGYSLCVDGGFSRKCRDQPNLEKDNCIGEGLQRGIYACPTNPTIGNEPLKITMGPDSIYNVWRGASLNSTAGCNPLSGIRVMESWGPDFMADPGGSAAPNTGVDRTPWNNIFGYIPLESSGAGGDNRAPIIPISDPSGSRCVQYQSKNTYPLSTTVVDPDNNLFGANFCTARGQRGYGPLKYRLYSHVQSYTVARGQLFDPTGVGYTGNYDSGSTVPPGGPGAKMGCDFKTTKDICGNEIRIPKPGDLAISGAAALLDINSNIAQTENISGTFLWNAYLQSADSDPFSYFSIGELVRQDLVKGDGPQITDSELSYDLYDIVQEFRKAFLVMSWAFQYMTGIGLVDKVCCVDPNKGIWKILIKDFWGNVLPPEYLPAEENLIVGKNPELSASQRAWKGDKTGPHGVKVYGGGVHKKVTQSDISRMRHGMTGTGAQFPVTTAGKQWASFVNQYSVMTGISIKGGEDAITIIETGSSPLGQTEVGCGATATINGATGSVFWYMRRPGVPWGCTGIASSWATCNSSDIDHTAPTREWGCTGPENWATGEPAYHLPPDWDYLSAINGQTGATGPPTEVIRWGVWKRLFAGVLPGGKLEGTSNGGGGIAFIAQNEINSYFKRLMGSSVSPVAIMGYKNTSTYRWGSANDGSTGGTSPHTSSMVRRAMLISGPDGGTAFGQYNPDFYNKDDYGVDILKYLEPQPYSVEKAAGDCGRKNLAFGNNTKQNYLVSYENNAGNVNFAVNQKLYTKYKP